MKIVFFGTSVFAVPSLKLLAGSDHKVVAVITQPDRQKGRNLSLKPPVIKEIATALNIPVFQSAAISEKEGVNMLRGLSADLFAVVSFGQLLSDEVLSMPKVFAVNLHASILPKYRGAAPINWALINGEKKTGVTVFRLIKKMDAGDIMSKKEIEIVQTDTAVTLSEKLSLEGARLMVETVDSIEAGTAGFNKQDESAVTFAPRLIKADGLIDWNMSAEEIHNRVRGFLPWPSAFTKSKDRILKILSSEVIDEPCKNGTPGRVVEIRQGVGIVVGTGRGCLAIKKLQLEGSRAMEFADFLNGHPLRIGGILGA